MPDIFCKQAIGNKEFSLGVFIDITNAFDTVNHSILLLVFVGWPRVGSVMILVKDIGKKTHSIQYFDTTH